MERTKETMPDLEHREPTFAMAIEMVEDIILTENLSTYGQTLCGRLLDRFKKVREHHEAYIRAKCGTIK